MGPSARGGEEGEPGDDHDAPASRPVNSGVSGGEGARGDRARALRASEPARASTRTIGTNRPTSIASPSVVLYSPCRRQPGEGRAVVVGRRGEGVDHLGQAVRPAVEHAASAAAARSPSPVTRTSAGITRMSSATSLISARRSSCPGTRGPPDHQTGDEHREHGEDQQPVEPGADPAGRDLAEHHVDQRHAATERAEAVVHRVDGARGGAGGRRGEEAEPADAEPRLLALQSPPGGRDPGRAGGQLRVAMRPRRRAAPSRAVMTARTAQPWRRSPTMSP